MKALLMIFFFNLPYNNYMSAFRICEDTLTIVITKHCFQQQFWIKYCSFVFQR